LVKNEKQANIKNFEKEQIAIIRERVESDRIFRTLNTTNKKNALNGKWKLNNSWLSLAKNRDLARSFLSKNIAFYVAMLILVDLVSFKFNKQEM
jgi:hypothetical protein